MTQRGWAAGCALALACLLLAPVAAAHFGGLGSAEARFRLPEWIVWVTGGLVVTFSFIVLGAYALRRAQPGTGTSPATREVREPPPGALRTALRGLGVGLFVLVAANGVVGRFGALPEAVVWLGAWSLLPIVAYAMGNPWPWLSPFRALAPFADRARGARPALPYPARLGAWPAVVFLLLLIALEVAPPSEGAGVLLGRLALAYAVLTFLGMVAFGSRVWLARAEVLDVVFARWAAAAPLERGPGGWRFRGVAGGLRALPGHGWDDAALIVAMLVGVNFDGFLGTPAGFAALRDLVDAGPFAARVIVLGAGFALFLGAFAWCVRAVKRVSESLEPLPVLAGRLAPVLLPIAVGYHLAHNLFYVAEQAPRLVHMLQDPLGQGWHLLGGALDALPRTFPIPSGAAVGGLQLTFILAGHVLAVVAAHDVLFARFPSRVQAVRSEGPLTAAMVLYTLVGLWVVSAAAVPAATLPQAAGVAVVTGMALASALPADPALACRCCGERQARPEYLALHLGRAHPGALVAEERAAFDAALAEEEAWLLAFQRHMRGGLATLPCVVFLLLSVFLLDALSVSLALIVLILPGMVAFGGLLYYFAWSKPV